MKHVTSAAIHLAIINKRMLIGSMKILLLLLQQKQKVYNKHL